MESSQSAAAVDVPVTCTEEQLDHLQEQQQEGEEQGHGHGQGQGGWTKEKEKECVHRTKVIQFLGRTTPIVLQNDNDPCPLLTSFCDGFGRACAAGIMQDYLASVDGATHAGLNMNSDLQLAIALQQQEFEQQQQPQQRNNAQQSSLGGSRLVSGPQAH